MKANVKGNPHAKWGYCYGFGVLDYNGIIKQNGKNLISYNLWRNMIQRCYDKSFLQKHPTYIGCKVCDEWKYFSNFKKWFDKNYINGWELDKDIKSFGKNKVYSPDNCCFVPHEINTFVTSKTKTKKDGLTSNIRLTSGKRYNVRVLLGGVNGKLGTYDKIEDAIKVLNNAKNKHLKDLALPYFQSGLLSEKVYNCLSSYF